MSRYTFAGILPRGHHPLYGKAAGHPISKYRSTAKLNSHSLKNRIDTVVRNAVDSYDLPSGLGMVFVTLEIRIFM